MVSGAVIIGRPIGPGMARPFTINNFFELEEKCKLGLIAKCPVEVAYPDSLNNPKLSYQEGILVNVFGGDDNPETFKGYLSRMIIRAGKLCEKLESDPKGFKPFNSDLCWGKIMYYHSSEDVYIGRITPKPRMEILETYEHQDAQERYLNIASDLVLRTRKARIDKYISQQKEKAKNDMLKIAEYCSKNFGLY